MTRPHTRMEIQTEILHKNFQLLQTQFGTPIMAVVKANAYGHGIAPIAQHLQQAGATMFGVATVDEGIALREAGITQGILVLTKLFAEEVSQALKHNLQVFVWEKEQIEAYHRAAQEAKGPLQVHLKINTGMGRLGAFPSDIEEIANYAATKANLSIQGVATHLANANQPDKSITEANLQAFASCVARLRQHLRTPLIVHAANSSGALLHPAARLDMVRLGAILFGIKARPWIQLPPGLATTFRWVTTISNVKTFPKNHGVGYDSTYRTQEGDKIGILPLGYADGYRQARKGVNEVLVRGKRIPVVGKLGMDQLMVDLTPLENPKAGEEVVLLGEQQGTAITLYELATRWEVPSLDVLIGIGPRVARVYR